MGFEYTPQDGYKLYIDKNIVYTGDNEAFRTLLSNGEASFQNYDDLKEFLRGLNCLYASESSETSNTSAEMTPNSESVSPDELANEIARHPIEIDNEEFFKNMTLKIIGQAKALKDLTDAAQIHLAQVSPKRPVSIFSFGPTGVGKTESAIALVDELNHHTNVNFKFIRIDCNQLMESHRISQLIGSPHGYVGFGEPAMLTPLADNIRCVILFDEIEKAHPHILKALMSVLDTGKIQLPSPINEIDELDCRYSIFIFTSNLVLKPEVKKIGFSGNAEGSTQVISNEDRYKEALVANKINSEIAGRIAWFLQYEPLSQEDIAKVIRAEVDQCANSYGLCVKIIHEPIIGEIIQSTGSKFGMRAYKQLISKKIGKAFASNKCGSTDITISGSLDVPIIRPY